MRLNSLHSPQPKENREPRKLQFDLEKSARDLTSALTEPGLDATITIAEPQLPTLTCADDRPGNNGESRWPIVTFGKINKVEIVSNRFGDATGTEARTDVGKCVFN